MDRLKLMHEELDGVQFPSYSVNIEVGALQVKELAYEPHPQSKGKEDPFIYDSIHIHLSDGTLITAPATWVREKGIRVGGYLVKEPEGFYSYYSEKRFNTVAVSSDPRSSNSSAG